MDKQLAKIITFVNHPDFSVFWLDDTTGGWFEIDRVHQTPNCLNGIFVNEGKGYIDLYNTDLNDIRIFPTFDWKSI